MYFPIIVLSAGKISRGIMNFWLIMTWNADICTMYKYVLPSKIHLVHVYIWCPERDFPEENFSNNVRVRSKAKYVT